MTLTQQALLDALDSLAHALEAPEHVIEVAELRRRVSTGLLRVLVVGEAKRGKSTLVNALVGKAVLPTGVVPLTSIPTTLTAGSPQEVLVTFDDGREEHVSAEALPELVTEQGNPGNRRGVRAVTVRVRSRLLEAGVELVDTPGTGSVHAASTSQALQALRRMDAAIFVLGIDPPISAVERELLREVRSIAVQVFYILAKVDRLTPAELGEVTAFTAQVLRAELGREATLWPMSAAAALTGGDSGFTAFQAELRDHLGSYHDAHLLASVSMSAARIARTVTEQAAATAAASELDAAELDCRLAQVRARLEHIDAQRAESRALLLAAFDRLRTQTDEQAAELLRRCAPDLRRSAATRAQGATGSAKLIERNAMDYVASQVTEIVSSWRNRRGRELDEQIQALDERLGRRLDEQVRAARTALAQQLSLHLEAPTAGAALVTRSRFTYSFEPDPGTTELLVSAIRGRLPGALGRRHVQRYVQEQAAFLLDRHLGRARSDFQQRLAQTARTVSKDLDQRFSQGVDHILHAAAQVQTDRERDSEAGRRQQRAASARGERAAAVLAVLVGAAPVSTRGRPARTPS